MNSILGLIAIIGLGLYALAKKEKESDITQSEPKLTNGEMKTVIVDTPTKEVVTKLSSTVLPPSSQPIVIKPTATPISKVTTVSPPTATTATVKKATVAKPTVAKTAVRTTTVKKATVAKPTVAKTAVSTTTVKKATVAKPTVAKTAVRTATVKVAPAASTQKLAAGQLDAYLRTGKMERATVALYQKKMGELTADGVAGPLTEKRAEKLLGRDVKWPAIEAAKNLYSYYVKNKGRDKTKIKTFQKAMGELTVDGLVGSKTKKRVRALTTINWN